MEKRRPLLVRAARRVAAILSVAIVIVFSMTTLVASAESRSSAAAADQDRPIAVEQFWREAMAADAGQTDPPSFLHANVTAQQCCKICTVGKACGDTCIAREKTCHVGAGCACDG